MKKENNPVSTIITIVIILIIGVLLYPFITYTNEKGETRCKNLIGFTYNCRD